MQKFLGTLLLILICTVLPAAEIRFSAIHIIPGPKADAVETKAVELLRDRIKEITTAPITLGPASADFKGLLIHIGTLQSYPELQHLAESLQIPLPSEFDPGTEGYILASKARGDQQLVLALGKDRRGVLYSVGEILRQLVGRGPAVEFPRELHLRHAPRWPMRGLNVSQSETIRELTNSRHWTPQEMLRAHLDYVLAGANTFELGPNGGPGNLFDELKSYGIDTLVCIVANSGQGPPEWQAKEGINRKGYLSPGIPAARKALLEQHEAIFKRMKPFDYIHLKSGDGGGDESEASAPYGRAMIELCEEYAQMLKKHQPQMKIFVGNQKLDNAGDNAIFAHLQSKPCDWCAGIMYGPGSNAMGWTPGRRQDHRTDLFHYARRGAMGGYLREMLHQLPPKQNILLFTDITHWVYSQYGLMDHELIADRNYQTPPKWDFEMYAHKPDPAMYLVYNRRTFHARPSAYYKAFQETAEFTIGDVAYSEGHHDHANVWTYLRLFWNPHQSVQDVVNEFSRFHFGPEAAPKMTEAIFTLEKNLETPIANNPGIDKLIALVESAGTLMPEDQKAKNFLWREYLEKAYLDKYIQLDVRRQNALYADVTTKLQSAFNNGQTAPADLHKTVTELAQQNIPDPTSDMLRLKADAERIGQENNTLYGLGNDGLFNLNQDYVGFGWLKRELEKAAAASPAQCREITAQILYNDDPGEGGFYDDAGNPEKSSHLVYGWPYDGAHVSPTNRRSLITMAFTTDEKKGVTFQYNDLDPNAQYKVRLALVRPKYKARYADLHHQTKQSIHADDVTLADNVTLPESIAEYFEYDIPQSTTRDGKLTVWMGKEPGIAEGLQSDRTIWRNTGGWGTLVSEVWLIKSGAPKRYQLK